MRLPIWRLKGLSQKFLSLVPGGGAVNDRLQIKLGGLKNFAGNIADKVQDWELMVEYLHKAGRGVEGQWLVEIGTGWYPTPPYAMFWREHACFYRGHCEARQ